MNITESTVQKAGSCDYCDRGRNEDNESSGVLYPYEKVFVVEGKHISSRFCEECFQELQEAGKGKKYRMFLYLYGGKEVKRMDLGEKPNQKVILEAMELYKADSFKIELITDSEE